MISVYFSKRDDKKFCHTHKKAPSLKCNAGLDKSGFVIGYKIKIRPFKKRAFLNLFFENRVVNFKAQNQRCQK